MPDIEEHITFKELKAVRCAIQSFLSELKGRRLLLHEDNQPVIGVLTLLTSKSPTMMCELRKLFLLISTPTTSRSGLSTSGARQTYWQTTCPASRTTPIGSWHHGSSSTLTRSGVPTRSTASPRSPTSNCPATTPGGETAPRRQWTAFAFNKTQSGEEKIIGATLLGNCSTTWSSSCGLQESRPMSSLFIGPRSRGSSTSPKCRARPSTCPPKPTSSFHKNNWGEGGGGG